MAVVLIVGGTGFLGAELVRRAARRGHTTHATHRQRPIAADVALTATWHPLDVTDAEAVAALVDAVRPDVVANAAYQQNGPDVDAICNVGAASLASACAAVDARFVHVSTDLVFDGTLGRSYTEADEPSPIMAYGQAKLDGEQSVLDALASALVVRTSIIYGSPDAPQEQLMRRALADDSIAFFTDEYRSPVHVTDLAEALLDLADTAAAGVLHLGSASRVDRHAFACALARHAGCDAAALGSRTQDPALGPRPADVSLDSSAAATVLGRALPGPVERLAQASTSDSS